MRRGAGAIVGVVVAVAVTANAYAYFTSSQTSPQTIQAVADFLPPTLSAQIYSLGMGGVVYPAIGYQVYAQVADPGNPPAGVKSVTADVGAITSGQTSLTLTFGSYSAGGNSYNYRSSTQIAGVLLPLGSSKPYSVTAADNANQTATLNANVTVQSSCYASGISSKNGNATPRRMEAGDSVTYSFSANIDQGSIVPGWSGGGSTPVTVKVTDTGTTNDQLTILSGSTTTPLGTVDTNGNYVSSTATFGGTMIESGNDVVVTFNGSPFGASTAAGPTAMKWTPGSGITAGGTACSTSSVTQPSAVDNF